MNGNRALLMLLVLALLSVDAVAFSSPAAERISVALASSQLALLTIWLVLGNGSGAGRLAWVTLAALAIDGLGAPAGEHFAKTMTWQWGLLAVGALALRVGLGRRLQMITGIAEAASSSQVAGVSARRRQFAIADVLLLITLIAIWLGMARNTDARYFFSCLPAAAGSSVITLVALLFVLRPVLKLWHVAGSWVALSVVATLTSVWSRNLTLLGPADDGIVIRHAILLLPNLVVLRVAGVRLIHVDYDRDQAEQPSTTASSTMAPAGTVATG